MCAVYVCVYTCVHVYLYTSVWHVYSVYVCGVSIVCMSMHMYACVCVWVHMYVCKSQWLNGISDYETFPILAYLKPVPRAGIRIGAKLKCLYIKYTHNISSWFFFYFTALLLRVKDWVLSLPMSRVLMASIYLPIVLRTKSELRTFNPSLHAGDPCMNQVWGHTWYRCVISGIQ